MRSLLLAGGLLAALAAGAPGAQAADLEYDHRDRHSSPYDDPRYRDLYGPAPRTTQRYSYEERTYRPPVPPHTVYRDDTYRDDDEVPESRRYAEGYRFGAHCLPRREIRRRLRDDGWGEIHDLELKSDVAILRARRLNGELYDLRIDRCTGAIVHARPLEHAVPGPFAYGPRRWPRRYF
jgi:hypothetical protein